MKSMQLLSIVKMKEKNNKGRRIIERVFRLMFSNVDIRQLFLIQNTLASNLDVNSDAVCTNFWISDVCRSN